MAVTTPGFRTMILGIMLPVLAAASALAQSAQRARTDTGREVILRGDGTWIYADPAASAVRQQPVAPPPAQPPAPPAAAAPIQRPRDATASITTRRGNFRVWYNPAKWRPSPEQNDGRIQFQLIGAEAYLVVIPEGSPLPIAQLKTLALENARQSGPDSRLVSEQVRSLAGREVLQLQINVTINSLPVAFLGYYYGDPRGSIQLVGYTGQQDLSRYRAQIMEALDGLDLNR